MAIVLVLFAILAALAGFGLFGAAKTSIHEIEGLILLLISAVLFAGGLTVDALKGLRKSLDKQRPA